MMRTAIAAFFVWSLLGQDVGPAQLAACQPAIPH
jgi:hypothetical protein